MAKTANIPNVEELTAANAAAIANLESVAHTALEAIESLSALNLNFARQSLDKGSKQVNAALKLKTPQEAAAPPLGQRRWWRGWRSPPLWAILPCFWCCGPLSALASR